jgi:hypothetical protein
MLVDTDLPQNGRSGVKKIYFDPEDLIYFAVQIEQIRVRGSPVARLLGVLYCRVSTRTRVVAIQRHDFLAPALNLHLLFHVSLTPRLRRR